MAGLSIRSVQKTWSKIASTCVDKQKMVYKVKKQNKLINLASNDTEKKSPSGYSRSEVVKKVLRKDTPVPQKSRFMPTIVEENKCEDNGKKNLEQGEKNCKEKNTKPSGKKSKFGQRELEDDADIWKNIE